MRPKKSAPPTRHARGIPERESIIVPKQFDGEWGSSRETGRARQAAPLTRRAGQSGALFGDAGVEDDDPPGFGFATERIENAGNSQLGRHCGRGGGFIRNRDAKAAVFHRGLLLIVRGAVMMGVFTAMLMNAMVVVRGRVRSAFMRERRVFELNKGSLPHPTDHKRGGDERDENRMLACAHEGTLARFCPDGHRQELTGGSLGPIQP